MSFLGGVRTYFDLQSEHREVEHEKRQDREPPAVATFSLGRMGGLFDMTPSGGGPATVLPQYFALVLGIVVQPYLQYYVQNGAWSLTISSVVGRVAFGIIIGLIAFPAVYKNAFDLDKPLLVQLCAIFSAGIGWQSVIQGGARAALGIPS